MTRTRKPFGRPKPAWPKIESKRAMDAIREEAAKVQRTTLALLQAGVFAGPPWGRKN